jgi:pimeloyl-ACP methyl ester carboxylesterase
MIKETGYAEVNGLRMYYEVHGSGAGGGSGGGSGAGGGSGGGGTPLVLLHGGLLTIDLSFGHLLPDLARDRRVIAPELQGHGHTADIDRAMDPRQLASDVAGLLDHLGVSRADILGFSLGGAAALQFVLDYPDRVRRAVIASVAYAPDGFRPEITDPSRSSDLLPTADDFAQMRAAYASTAPDPGHFEAFQGKLQGAVHGHQGWTADELGTVRVPVLLVFGDKDFIRLEHAVGMNDLIPGAQLAVLPDATHMELLRRTALIVPLVEEFLS